MEDKPEEKQSWRPKFRSEFSMGELDFKRYDKWLDRGDISSAGINSTTIPTLQQVQNYFAELNVLYKNWKGLISNPIKSKEIEDKIKRAKQQKRTWESSLETGQEMNKYVIYSLIDLLDEIHTSILEVKQVIGLGIVVKRVLSASEKIKFGIKPKKDLNDLPEV